MTELVIARIQTVFATIDEGIVTLGDAQFLVQLARAQSDRFLELVELMRSHSCQREERGKGECKICEALAQIGEQL